MSDWMDSAAASSGTAKAFRCSFCNKGFSTAQALGGHMNIHRRDRAKLMQSTDQTNEISLETSGRSPGDDKMLDDQKSSSPKMLSPDSREEDIGEASSTKARVSGVEENPDKQSSRLMSVESTSNSKEPVTTLPSIGGDEHSESGIIDLELRLGQEPRFIPK